jgi:hypothetical protein
MSFFFKFNDSILVLNPSFMSTIALFILSLKSQMLGLDTITLVSSAYRMILALLFDAFGRLLGQITVRILSFCVKLQWNNTRLDFLSILQKCGQYWWTDSKSSYNATFVYLTYSFFYSEKTVCTSLSSSWHLTHKTQHEKLRL